MRPENSAHSRAVLSDLATARVDGIPFPHAVIDDVLPDALFARLAAAFPPCPAASGPTGFTIHRGDPEFDAVMAASPEWAALYAQCNSPEFVAALTQLFAAEIDAASTIERSKLHWADHIETRAEKETGRLTGQSLPPEALHVRFDFMEGRESYARAPHLDHRRRLATMLLYFNAPGEDSYSGGDLLLHEPGGALVGRIEPKANRAVLFPCSPRSWHAVEPVRAVQVPRRFMQLSVSSCHDIWPDQRGWGERLVAQVRRVVGG